ncbi:MAG: winged helix-turn-helix domain-containing protein [Myxococcota bacterium]
MMRFGEFELDLPKAELRRGRLPVPIQPRVFRLLTHLVMNRHRVVTQDELLDTVWAREAVVPSVLSTAVRALRRTLGDDSREPRYVQTVHRVGYGFIGRVDEAVDDDEARAVPPIQWARHVAFVGRVAETQRFLQGVANPQSREQLLWVTGPAGVGKTTLLEELRCQCTVAGRRAVTLRADELVPRPDALARTLARALEIPDAEDPLTQLPRCPFSVLFIDGYDLLAPIDAWLHASLWPAMPSQLRLVLASRAEPPARWCCDPAWSQAATHLELDAFGEGNAREFLARQAVDPRHFERVWDFTHGHPLAMALVVDALRRSRGVFEPSQRLGVIDALVAWFVDRLPSRGHLHALQAACLMGRVSPRSLAALVDAGGDAEEFFDWLSGLSFVEPAANGVRVHDLVRESVLAQLSARDSDRLATLLGRGAERALDELRCAEDYESRRRAIALFMSLGRYHPALPSFYHQEAESLRVEVANVRSSAFAEEVVETHEGGESADIVRRWLPAREASTWVVRDDNAIEVALVLMLQLDVDDRACAAWDPVAASIFRYLDDHDLARPGDRILVHRYLLAREDYQAPSAAMQCCHEVVGGNHFHCLSEFPECVHSFIVYGDPDLWQTVQDFYDFTRAPEAYEVPLGPRRATFFYHSFRDAPFVDWVQGQILGRLASRSK